MTDATEVTVTFTRMEFEILQTFIKLRAGYLFDRGVPETISLLKKLRVD